MTIIDQKSNENENNIELMSNSMSHHSSASDVFFFYFLLYCFLMAGYLLRSWHLSLMEFSSEPWKHCDSPSQSLLKSNNCRTSVEAFTCGGEKDTPILEGSLTLILNLTRI